MRITENICGACCPGGIGPTLIGVTEWNCQRGCEHVQKVYGKLRFKIDKLKSISIKMEMGYKKEHSALMYLNPL